MERSQFSAGSESEFKQGIHFKGSEGMLNLTFIASLRMGSSMGFIITLIDCEAERLRTHPSPDSLMSWCTDGVAFKPLKVCTNTSKYQNNTLKLSYFNDQFQHSYILQTMIIYQWQVPVFNSRRLTWYNLLKEFNSLKCLRARGVLRHSFHPHRAQELKERTS